MVVAAGAGVSPTCSDFVGRRSPPVAAGEPEVSALSAGFSAPSASSVSGSPAVAAAAAFRSISGESSLLRMTYAEGAAC